MSVISTLLVLGIIGAIVVNLPTWPRVQEAFFNADVAARAAPKILAAFGRNVMLFLLAEVFVLILGLILAVLRSLKGPVFTPIRGFAIIYVDVFRGLPGILVIYVLGLGLPALGVTGDEFFWGLMALVLIYSAYVSEVYRAGIESIHPSQEAAARSLGLSQWKALRFVIVPQAVRRIIPPLLNDFIGLQKDTALLAFVGTFEALNVASSAANRYFNQTPILGAGLCFLVITIPLARFTDYLVKRDATRMRASS